MSKKVSVKGMDVSGRCCPSYVRQPSHGISVPQVVGIFASQNASQHENAITWLCCIFLVCVNHPTNLQTSPQSASKSSVVGVFMSDLWCQQ